jgi:hypothetical protein
MGRADVCSFAFLLQLKVHLDAASVLSAVPLGDRRILNANGGRSNNSCSLLARAVAVLTARPAKTPRLNWAVAGPHDPSQCDNRRPA